MSKVSDADILKVTRLLDEAKPTKDRKMALNKSADKSLRETIYMIQQLGEGRLEVWYGDTKYTLTLKEHKDA